MEITLTADAGGTVLVLRHLDMPTNHAGDHEKGWAHYVDERLVAALAESETTIPAVGVVGASG